MYHIGLCVFTLHPITPTVILLLLFLNQLNLLDKLLDAELLKRLHQPISHYLRCVNICGLDTLLFIEVSNVVVGDVNML